MFVNKTKVFSPVILMVVLGMVLLAVISCSPDGDDKVDEDVDQEPQYGGILEVAFGMDPGNFDLHMGTISRIGDHMAEHLFEPDANFKMHEDLAESHTISEDGMVHTVKLHEGILFHNGKELTSEDVVASIERWLAVISTPPEFARVYDSVAAVDTYTVELRLNQPTGDLKEMLSVPSCVILPREVCEKYPAEQIPHDEFIGTGPYKLKNYLPDRYVHMIRFEDYIPRGEEIKGRAGRKNAYFDEIIFHIVPDAMVRLMGVETGQFHVGMAIDFWEYERLSNHPHLDVGVTYPWDFMRVNLNCANPPTDDVRIRLAMQAAIDVKEVMDAGIPPELYELSPSKVWAERWYSEAGSEYYNQANPTLARQLLQEAGYDGEPVVLLGLAEFPFLRDAAIVVAKQLEDAGFNVELQLYDVVTAVITSRGKTSWHLFCITTSILSTPTMVAWTREEHVGWWKGETLRKLELGQLLRTETDHQKRYAIWEELQELSYAEANEIWLGPFPGVGVTQNKFKGFGNWPEERFWNSWFQN